MSTDVLDIAPVEVQAVSAPAPRPAAAPAAPDEIIAAATGLKGSLAADLAGRIVLALGEAGWWFVHDSQPGKRTGYRAGRDVVAGER